jgi:hypothetical protein
LTPNDGALGQASPKDAQRRHVATLAINLVFCPLSSIIELILLSENETYERILQNILRLFFRNTSYGCSSREVPSGIFASLRTLRLGAKPVAKF